MNNKEIIKHFYEVVVSRNLLDEIGRASCRERVYSNV